MGTDKLFDVPNLDGLSIDPADYGIAKLVLGNLASYCNAKQRAMENRLAGLIGEALIEEGRADRIYKRLPEWAKW